MQDLVWGRSRLFAAGPDGEEFTAMCCNTKQKIARALRQLMSERPLSKITVQDLMEGAQMKRQSFYYHFQDIYDVLGWICEKQLGQPLREEPELDFEEWCMRLVALMEEDRAFYRRVFLAGNPEITSRGDAYVDFVMKLHEICYLLARSMAKDGEGAKHLITCTVSGAKSEEQAETISKSVISSTLTKAAIFGCDANWGRVLCAMGYSGEQFDPEKVDVTFSSSAGDILVCQNGRGLAFDEELAKKILTEDEVDIDIAMAEGDESCTCWGCDITYDYIKINGDYRT